MYNFDELREEYNDLGYVSIGERFSTSWEILTDGFKAFFKYPVLLIPVILHIIFTTLISAGAYLYCLPYVDDIHSMPVNYAISLSLIYYFLISTANATCSFIILEFIQQIESGEKINIGKAFQEALCIDIIRGLPLIFMWTIISFIGGFLKGKRKGETFVGTCIRLSFYCIFPAIAWEDKGSFEAIKKGLKVLKATFREVFFSIIQTELVALLIALFIPLFAGIIYMFRDNRPFCLLLVIIFLGIAVFIGALCKYIGQIFTASIFLWYKKWESECYIASINNQPKPSLYDIPQPSLLDDIPDLAGIKAPKYL